MLFLNKLVQFYSVKEMEGDPIIVLMILIGTAATFHPSEMLGFLFRLRSEQDVY